MLTDKQSLIICAVVALGFSICGILGILYNYVIVAVLLLLFVLVVVNLLTNKHFYAKDEDIENNKEDTL